MKIEMIRQCFVIIVCDRGKKKREIVSAFGVIEAIYKKRNHRGDLNVLSDVIVLAGVGSIPSTYPML